MFWNADLHVPCDSAFCLHQKSLELNWNTRININIRVMLWNSENIEFRKKYYFPQLAGTASLSRNWNTHPNINITFIQCTQCIVLKIARNGRNHWYYCCFEKRRENQKFWKILLKTPAKTWWILMYWMARELGKPMLKTPYKACGKLGIFSVFCDFGLWGGSPGSGDFRQKLEIRVDWPEDGGAGRENGFLNTPNTRININITFMFWITGKNHFHQISDSIFLPELRKCNFWNTNTLFPNIEPIVLLYAWFHS